MRNAGLIQTFGPSLGGGDCGALCALPVAWASKVGGEVLKGEKFTNDLHLDHDIFCKLSGIVFLYVLRIKVIA